MPIGEGFWLKSGKPPVPIYEHMMAITGDPERFGMTPASVQRREGEDDVAQRDRVLRAVMAKGWIRVRSHRGHTVFEYDTLNRKIADTIFEFIVDYLGRGPGQTFKMNEVSTNRSFTVRAVDFYEDVEAQLRGCESTGSGEKLFFLGCAMGQGRTERRG